MNASPCDVGIVVIGRNEGERLRRCLESLASYHAVVVYVDSGSTDNSVELAKSLGAHAVELDLAIGFTAARARNEGLELLLTILPKVEFVQFVDGDCEVAPGWIQLAMSRLEGDPRLAAVCGRRRERFPNASVYNRLCDIEWNTEVGIAKACGGDVMFRTAPLEEVGRYDPLLIAGEEPELCIRLRHAGWLVERVDAEMTIHDAAMFRFGQWWRRAVRAGHAYAQGAAMYGRSPESHYVRQLRSSLTWGALLPIVATAFAWSTSGFSLLIALGLYLLLCVRVFLSSQRRLDPFSAYIYALNCIGAKFAETVGAAKYFVNQYRRKRSCLIEYK
ncbi:glycosyltransferase family 2 protein [Blastopirellula marina]|uniref:Glycosyl transferase n=1 Tax=Blastopirellula marina TaxID=124 RepID=A0A2S8GNI4_9BACT|nr:glycosyltransferase family 2 protein [Blastopirellula marina]PQO45972.1 glycosyl transferase [Blastopirellula marina]